MTSTRKTKTTRTRRKTKGGPDAKAIALGTLSVGAVVGAIAAAAFGILKLGRRGGDAGHVPTDLMGDARPGPEDRAIDAFRPDPTAAVADNERDAFRPALAGAAAPTLIKGEARENDRLDAAPS